MAIYGLASLGFEKFLEELPSEPIFENYQEIFGQRLQELESSQLTTQQ
jgi:hypothetical protein